MTESEWLSCSAPVQMLRALRGRVSDRKMRLFACACCRRVWRFIPDPRYRRVGEVAERYADGLVGEPEREDVRAAGSQAGEEWRQESPGRTSMEAWLVMRAYRAASTTLVDDIGFWADHSLTEAARAEGIELLMKENREQPSGDEFRRLIQQLLAPYCEPLQCIMGNPFRAVSFDLKYRTSTVVALATTIYESKSFELMPVLADALSDAGCDDEQILGHCRGAGEHYRGCWVIDLVLQKS